MITWKTAKRWKYKGRDCEIHVGSFDGVKQYRGYVAVGDDFSPDALDVFPDSEEVSLTERTKRGRTSKRESWLCCDLGTRRNADLSVLRERVHEVARLTHDAADPS